MTTEPSPFTEPHRDNLDAALRSKTSPRQLALRVGAVGGAALVALAALL